MYFYVAMNLVLSFPRPCLMKDLRAKAFTKQKAHKYKENWQCNASKQHKMSPLPRPASPESGKATQCRTEHTRGSTGEIHKCCCGAKGANNFLWLLVFVAES